MTYPFRPLVDKIFRDSNGRLAIAQFPNLPLWGWIVFSLLTVVFKHGKAHTGFRLLAQSTLFIWAYLELRSGDSLFRKALGALVFVSVFVSYFT
jgi:hypothetical protein